MLRVFTIKYLRHHEKHTHYQTQLCHETVSKIKRVFGTVYRRVYVITGIELNVFVVQMNIISSKTKFISHDNRNLCFKLRKTVKNGKGVLVFCTVLYLWPIVFIYFIIVI